MLVHCGPASVSEHLERVRGGALRYHPLDGGRDSSVFKTTWAVGPEKTRAQSACATSTSDSREIRRRSQAPPGELGTIVTRLQLQYIQ